jgi:glyoxylase-like metal-dependent hydrolase (beta-lactamase superfamily II)
VFGILATAGPASAQLNPSYKKYSASHLAKVFSNGDVHVLPVQGNIYMIVAGKVNVVAQVGDDGILLVDTGTKELAGKLTETLRLRFDNRPIRYIINTSVNSEHTGGNETVVKYNRTRNAPPGTAPEAGGGGGGGGGGGANAIRVIAHEMTLNRMNGSVAGETEAPPDALPTSAFIGEKKKIYFNGEPIEIIANPRGTSDGDVMVFFRGSDVIASGDLFRTDSYPVIDVKRGGTVQGVLDGLNRILDITVPEFNEQGGTRVIPGHGRLCNESDVDDYRNWMTIINYRVQDFVKAGKTLDQIKAAKPTLDFDGVFGNGTAYLEAAYNDLTKDAKSAAAKAAPAKAEPRGKK